MSTISKILSSSLLILVLLNNSILRWLIPHDIPISTVKMKTKLSMTPNRKSKHKRIIRYVSPLVPYRNKSIETLNNLNVRGHKRINPKGYTSIEFIKLCIHHMILYHWYRILLFSNFECNTIVFSIM